MPKTPTVEADKQEYEDHSVIMPPHRLKTAVFHTSEPGDIPMDVVERAEAALASLKGEFTGWMQAECDRLDAASRSLHQNGPTKLVLDMLFRASQDIKGDAATLGYPIAGPLASALCRLLYHAPDPGRIPLALVDRFVEAIRAVVRESVRSPEDPVAIEVADSLAEMVENFLAAELQDEYAEIAGDAAPPLTVPQPQN
jgi:chemotaxis protein histidine kinase CheA